MASLYEINNEINALLQSDYTQDESIVNYETGEITTIAEKLDELELDLKTKLDNVACYIKNLTADVDAIKNEEKNLAERRKVKENQLNRLKEYLANNLIIAGYNKFESARCVLSFRTSKAIEIAEGTELNEKYLNVKVITEPDKKALKEAIELGETIDGVQLIEKKNLQIK